MSAVVATILIWRGWIHALELEASGDPGILASSQNGHVVGLGICAAVAGLTTVTLVVCASARIHALHAGADSGPHARDVAVSSLTLRTASAAIVALAVAAIAAIALGM